MSEALYLQDPDNLGVEVYRDRPRAEWTVAQGRVAMASLPLDARGLLQAAAGVPWTGLPAGTVIGHVHLHVGDLDESTRFYRDVLGLAVTQDGYPGAVFLSAGGYHHHLGTNVWAGADAVAAPDSESRLLEWTVRVPDAADVAAVRARATPRADHLPATASAATASADDVTAALRLADPWGTHVVVRASGP